LPLVLESGMTTVLADYTIITSITTSILLLGYQQGHPSGKNMSYKRVFLVRLAHTEYAK